jgi:RHS repeat-associated protein
VRESATHPLDRYVWGVEYIDAPIIRYRDGNVNGELDDEGDSSLYYLHDANFNVTGLIDKAETAVVERYMYEPYGRVTVLNGAADADESVNDWSADADNASDWSNEVLYAGYRRDAESALYHVRNRYYHPTLGRWVSRDPTRYEDGPNMLEYVGGSPVSWTDATGLACGPGWLGDIVVPDKPGGFDFTQACQNHDDCYSTCGKSKRECDNQFQRDMLAVCDLYRYFPQDYEKCSHYAMLYYLAVHDLGNHSYKMAQARVCRDPLSEHVLCIGGVYRPGYVPNR